MKVNCVKNKVATGGAAAPASRDLVFDTYFENVFFPAPGEQAEREVLGFFKDDSKSVDRVARSRVVSIE